MQEIIVYLKPTTVNASIVDEWGQPGAAIPAVVRGTQALLCLRLLSVDNAPFPPAQLQALVGWEFVVAHDWLSSTPAQLRVTSGIRLITSAAKTELQIPLENINTDELIQQLGNSANVTLGAELVGFEPGNPTPVFCNQFSLMVVNRRSDAGTGNPVPVPDGNYSAVQIDALLAAGFAVEFAISNTATSGHVDQAAADRVYRFRNPQVVNAQWSPWIAMIVGPTGAGLQIDAVGLLADRPTAPALKYCYYATDMALAYFYTTTGWSDGVTITGENGAQGSSIDYNPILSAGNGKSGDARRVWLGDDADTMTFFDDQYDVSTVVLRVVSANAAITGNIVLVSVVNGVDGAAVVVPIGATVAPVELTLSDVNGRLSIRRDWQDARDTLRDGTPIAAVVVAWEVDHG